MQFRQPAAGFCSAILLAFSVAGCTRSGTQPLDVVNEPDSSAMAMKSDKIVVYQVMTRLFGNKKTTNKRFGTIEENGVGKFADFTTEALAAIRELGATHIWYTGVIEHATMTDYSTFGIPPDDADVVKGRAGSPYAIKDYYDVDPDLAIDVNNRMGEFEELVKRTHQSGLKLLIDFVPNHVARKYYSDAKPAGIADFGSGDNPNVAFHPDNNFYYVPGQPFKVPEGYDPLPGFGHPTKNSGFTEMPAKATGNDVFSAAPSVHDWFETVKLNYGVDYLSDRRRHFDPIPDTWDKMYEVLSYWSAKGVDGFRCDMAEMVPVEFWQWVIPRIKEQYPDILFIAEIYKPDEYRDYLFRGSFDYLYDKVELYDTLKHIIQGSANTDHLTSVWQRQEGITNRMLRFLENHDEQRIASPFFAGNPQRAIPAMVLTATMHTGPVMVYFGQEVGEPGAGNEGFQGEDGRTTIFDYWGVPNHQAWMNGGRFDGGRLSGEQKDLRNTYKYLLNLSRNEALIAEGSFYDLHYFNRTPSFQSYSDKVYCFLRHDHQSALLIAVSFNQENPEAVRAKVPEDALRKFGSEGATSINMVDFQNEAGSFTAAISDLTAQQVLEKDFIFEIKPNSFRIFRLTTN